MPCEIRLPLLRGRVEDQPHRHPELGRPGQARSIFPARQPQHLGKWLGQIGKRGPFA